MAVMPRPLREISSTASARVALSCTEGMLALVCMTSLHVGEQTASQAAAGMGTREIVFAETLGIEQGHRQCIAQRECGGGAGRGRESHRAGFLRHRAVQMRIGRQRQAGLRVAGQADQVRALALDGGHDGEQFVAFAGIGNRDEHVLRRDHAEIAVAGFARMHEISGRAGAGHGRRDLARDVPGLSHAADNDSSLAREDEVQGLQKVIVDALGKCPHSIGFNVQYLTCKVECMRCGGEWFVHAADYNSAVWGRRFFENVASSSVKELRMWMTTALRCTAQAGIQCFFQHAVGFVFAAQSRISINWIPACAGMTAYLNYVAIIRA